VDVDPEALEEGFAGIAEQEQNRHNRIEEIIEPGMTRAFYLQVGDDDLG
jgi:hypothetical protein